MASSQSRLMGNLPFTKLTASGHYQLVKAPLTIFRSSEISSRTFLSLSSFIGWKVIRAKRVCRWTGGQGRMTMSMAKQRSFLQHGLRNSKPPYRQTRLFRKHWVFSLHGVKLPHLNKSRLYQESRLYGNDQSWTGTNSERINKLFSLMSISRSPAGCSTFRVQTDWNKHWS